MRESMEDSVEERFRDEVREDTEFKTEFHELFEIHHESLVCEENVILDDGLVKNGEEVDHVLLLQFSH
jgi:hypothetical protein